VADRRPPTGGECDVGQLNFGVDHKGVAEHITKLVPDYMVMGDKWMADMGSMEMPLPDNTLPMMTATGPFGRLEMGGMFSIVKVRDDVQRGYYKDPGFYKHPRGTVAYEYTGQMQQPMHAPAPKADSKTMNVRKPVGSNHSNH
jgi:manganese oxidase